MRSSCSIDRQDVMHVLYFRFKLNKARSARNKILAKAVNIQKRKLVKAKKL